MKKRITMIAVFALASALTFAQTIVPTAPENKNVVLEEFTGIHCGYCPQGHQVAHQILTAHPDDASVIAIHTGGYATPGAGEPDFRTPWGSAIAGQSNLAGYPAGTVNRHEFPGWSQGGTGTALGRAKWVQAANKILAEPSYLNVEAKATIVRSSRQMQILVEVYYTANSPEGTNYLNVAVLQDNIKGPQSGGGAGNNYNHMHMLRDLVTGQWGIPINTTSATNFYTTTLSYDIPADINGVDMVLEDLHVVAFVAESHQEIISGNGAEMVLVESVALDAAVQELLIPATFCAGEISPKVKIKNFGTETLTSLKLNYQFNEEAATEHTWTGSLATGATTEVALPAFTPTTINGDGNSITVVASAPNGSTDELLGNNTKVQQMDACVEATKNCKMAFYIPNGEDQVTWSIKDAAGNEVISGGPYTSKGVYQHPFTFPTSGVYTFTLHDTGGDAFGGSGFVKLFSTNGKPVIWEADMDSWSSDLCAQFGYNYNDGVEEISALESTRVYPNPANDNTTLVYTLQQSADVEIQLFDALGKQVSATVKARQEVGVQEHTFDLSNLQSGLYIVTLTINGERISKKISVM